MAKAKTWEEHLNDCLKVIKPGIQILGWVGEWKAARTVLKCSCPVHGEWTSTTIHKFKMGRSCPSCRCVKTETVRESLREKFVKRIEEACTENNLTFKGFVGEYSGRDSHLKILCGKHGEFIKQAAYFLGRNYCPLCRSITRQKIKPKVDLSRHIQKLMQTGYIPYGSEIKAIEKKQRVWSIKCSVCGKDTSRTESSFMKRGLICSCRKTQTAVASLFTPTETKNNCVRYFHKYVLKIKVAKRGGSVLSYAKQWERLLGTHVEIGNKTVIKVVGVTQSQNTDCAVTISYECLTCATKDPDMYLGEVFSTQLRYGKLKPVQLRCGCATHPNAIFWSDRRIALNIQRIYADTDVEFVRFKGGVNRSQVRKTRVILRSDKYGEWESSYAVILTKKTLRPAIFPMDLHVKEFMATGSFHADTKFTRDNKDFYVHCPVCATDEFALAGLCTGVFKSKSNKLKNGELPCRCSKTPTYTREQLEWLIKKELNSRTTVLTFVRWDNQKNFSKRSYFYFNCPEHGETRVQVNNFLSQHTGCGGCRGKTQQECYINLVLDTDFPVAIKFGIANNSNQRLTVQNRRNRLAMKRDVLYRFPTIQQCKSAERRCRKDLVCKVVSKQDMPDGWTETVALTDYDKVVSIYERFGGVLVKEVKDEK